MWMSLVDGDVRLAANNYYMYNDALGLCALTIATLHVFDDKLHSRLRLAQCDALQATAWKLLAHRSGPSVKA